MVKKACFDKNGMKKGAWSEEEDNQLRAFIDSYGHKNWRLVPKFAGLKRCGKSCRLRWVNYLKPGVMRGNFSKHEVDLIIHWKQELGNKWSAIAEKLPGRTDNDIKNYWHAHINKSTKLRTRKCSPQVSNGVPKINALYDQVSYVQNPQILESSTSNDDNSSSSDSFPENDQIDFWNDPLLAYVANHENENCLPILPEEGDLQLHDIELSIMSPISSSLLLSNFGWIAEGYEHGMISPDSVIPQISFEQESFWNEPPFLHDHIQQAGDINDSTTLQAEGDVSFYDPSFLSSILL